MRTFLKGTFFIALTLTAVTTSCASIKTLNVWKDEGNNERLEKVLVLAVAELDFMQEHFENVLSDRLASRGIDAIPANKVFSQSTGKPGKEAILAKVRELGIKSVLVARPVSKEETAHLSPGGANTMPVSSYTGWYSFYSGSIAFAAHSAPTYDAEFFMVVTNIYEVSDEKLIWSSLSKVKVENSRQGAINPFIDVLVKQMEKSKLI